MQDSDYWNAIRSSIRLNSNLRNKDVEERPPFTSPPVTSIFLRYADAYPYWNGVAKSMSSFTIPFSNNISNFNSLEVISARIVQAFTSDLNWLCIQLSPIQQAGNIVSMQNGLAATFYLPMTPSGGLSAGAVGTWKRTSEKEQIVGISNQTFSSMTFQLLDENFQPLVYNGTTTGFAFEILLKASVEPI